MSLAILADDLKVPYSSAMVRFQCRNSPSAHTLFASVHKLPPTDDQISNYTAASTDSSPDRLSAIIACTISIARQEFRIRLVENDAGNPMRLGAQHFKRLGNDRARC